MCRHVRLQRSASLPDAPYHRLPGLIEMDESGPRHCFVYSGMPTGTALVDSILRILENRMIPNPLDIEIPTFDPRLTIAVRYGNYWQVIELPLSEAFDRLSLRP